MDVITLARELGFAIQNDPDYIDFKIKEQNVECNEDLQQTIKEFDFKKLEINNEISKNSTDTSKIDKLNSEIGALYQKMVNHEVMKKYNESKMMFSKKLQKVSLIINKSAEGTDPYSIDVEDEEDCTGNCQTCGGCR